jgi:prephenate dehydrogenase
LINSKIAEYETILKSVGKVCGFSHFYSGKTHVGTLEKFSQNEIVLKKLMSKGTAPQIKNQFIKLKLENLRLLSESELRQWRKENLKHSTRDISVLIPNGADPEIILKAISTNKNLAACEISDVYSGSNVVENYIENKWIEMLAVSYRITVFGDCDANFVENDVTAFLCGIGCCIRKTNFRLKEQK